MRKLSCRVRLAGQVDCIFRFLTGCCAAAGNARPSAAVSAVRTSRGFSLLRMTVSLKVDFSISGGRCEGDVRSPLLACQRTWARRAPACNRTRLRLFSEWVSPDHPFETNTRRFRMKIRIKVVPALAAALLAFAPGPLLAVDAGEPPARSNPDHAAGKRAIEARDWNGA